MIMAEKKEMLPRIKNSTYEFRRNPTPNISEQ